jgi:hypothetical protein
MAQAAEPDDPDARRRADAPPSKRRKDRSARAEERRGRSRVEPVGQRKDKPRVGADALRESAHVPDTGRLLTRAEVFVSAKAQVAFQARRTLPSDAHPLSYGHR